jgi:transposase-like protein
MEQSSRRKRREFSAESKVSTVELILSSGKWANEVCRELKLTETAVRRSVKQARTDASQGPGLTSDEREPGKGPRPSSGRRRRGERPRKRVRRHAGRPQCPAG